MSFGRTSSLLMGDSAIRGIFEYMKSRQNVLQMVSYNIYDIFFLNFQVEIMCQFLKKMFCENNFVNQNSGNDT